MCTLTLFMHPKATLVEHMYDNLMRKKNGWKNRATLFIYSIQPTARDPVFFPHATGS